MKQFISSFILYLRNQQINNNTKLIVYDVINHTGNWRSIMCRYSERNKSMLILLRISIQDNEKEIWEKEKKQLIEWYNNEIKTKYEIVSFYIQIYNGVSNPNPGDPMELIDGNEYIVENLLNIQFRISPDSFFQVYILFTVFLYFFIYFHIYYFHNIYSLSLLYIFIYFYFILFY